MKLLLVAACVAFVAAIPGGGNPREMMEMMRRPVCQCSDSGFQSCFANFRPPLMPTPSAAQRDQIDQCIGQCFQTNNFPSCVDSTGLPIQTLRTAADNFFACVGNEMQNFNPQSLCLQPGQTAPVMNMSDMMPNPRLRSLMQCKKRCMEQVADNTNKAEWEAIHSCVRDQMNCRPLKPSGCDAQHATLKSALESCTGIRMPNML